MKAAVLILSHGRADRVRTLHTLRRQGYTGDVYVVVDDTDAQLEAYRARFGEQLVVFDKEEAKALTDDGDNFDSDKAVVYARNMCWKIAEQLGLTHFLVLDDDYYVFSYRRTHTGGYTGHSVRGGLDNLIKATFEFLDGSGFSSVAWAQGGDHIGGAQSNLRFRRKVMNSFFCRTDRPFQFYGKINEDTTTYVYLGRKGHLFGTVMVLQLDQADTQSSEGGLTTIYLDMGTYVKSFYSVMYAPSCVSINLMGEKHRRMHHKVTWNCAAPKIIRAEHKKPAHRVRKRG